MMKYRPEDVGQWMNRFMDMPMRMVGQWLPRGPAIDLLEQDEDIVARVEVPGVSPERLEVIVKGATLTVRGEWEEDQGDGEEGAPAEHRFGKFTRTVTLPDEVRGEAARARSRHGVLEVVMPRKNALATAHRVPIDTGEQAR